MLSADATRLKGTDTQPLAKRTVGSFFSLQPWPKVQDCYNLVGSPEAADIKM